MGRNNRVDAQDDDDDYDDVFERKNKDLLNSLNIKLKLNYFPNDQTKHIDYVIYYTEKVADEKIKNDKKFKKRKALRFNFLDQLKTQEGFEIDRIVKQNSETDTDNYLLLNCSLERYIY
jgi:hypothetical protein